MNHYMVNVDGECVGTITAKNGNEVLKWCLVNLMCISETFSIKILKEPYGPVHITI